MSRRRKPNSRRPGAAQQHPWLTAEIEVTKVTQHPETNSSEVEYRSRYLSQGHGYGKTVIIEQQQEYARGVQGVLRRVEQLEREGR